MIRRILMLLALLLVLVACGGDEEESDNESDSQDATPTVELAPTDNTDPSGIGLGGDVDDDESCAISLDPDADEDCAEPGLGLTPVVNLNNEPQLIEQEVLGITISVPEGFEALPLSDTRVVFEPTDTERYPGQVQFFVEWLSGQELEALLATYANLDEDQRVDYTEPVEGYTIPQGDEATVGVWQVEPDRLLVIRGAAASPVWEDVYRDLFESIFTSVELSQ